MIVVPIQLYSAVTGKVTTLGTLVLDNIGGTKDRCDYRVRVYRKGAEANGAASMVRTAKPTREARVLSHRRLAEPVGNLIAKAMKEVGYG